ncbi:hypothetical protein B0H67DRAFT_167304 [Lasiosphaeris hirsuta]|uniref:2EXR domain-containing protein n=1 Tax=Lasiosphaeris hirsuta TaxID=260670 RepID=A0AA40AQ10_9PEZI|nr:hypothetical protein B0H67DRAFT_167304 [Lasiosphaeris hirsuta]
MTSIDSATTQYDSQSYLIKVMIQLTIIIGWFSKRLKRYTRLVQEASREALEERRLLDAQQPLTGSTTPTTFPQFNHLPPELRHQIWAEALPGPRVLMLKPPSSSPSMPSLSDCLSWLSNPFSPEASTRKRRYQNSSISNVWTCTTSVPAVLHVCSEARAIGLRHYRLGLAPGSSEPRIYVDFMRDVVGLSDELMQSPAGRNLWRLTNDLQHVQKIALASGSAPSFLAMRQPYGLANVEEVALVDSALWGTGLVPRVAQLDWSYWVQWQCGKGLAQRWVGARGVDGRRAKLLRAT